MINIKERENNFLQEILTSKNKTEVFKHSPVNERGFLLNVITPFPSTIVAFATAAFLFPETTRLFILKI